MWEKFMALAIQEAERYLGATAPNPSVGACVLDTRGEMLALGAHMRAGGAHAEVAALLECRKKGRLADAHTLVVTLEPCNHMGRTPPCTQAIVEAGIQRVVLGTRDPNARVTGGGAEWLRNHGVEVIEGVMEKHCRHLIRAWAHWVGTTRPWVTVKTALLPDGSMLPPPGLKTFTSKSSLLFAHQLRRRADAILTGSGTVIADDPLFTVRHVEDHPEKRRHLVVMDRQGRVSQDWIDAAGHRGFDVIRSKDVAQVLDFLGQKGVLEVLVEAGPTLSEFMIREGFWNEHIVITRGSPDQVEVRLNPQQPLSSSVRSVFP